MTDVTEYVYEDLNIRSTTRKCANHPSLDSIVICYSKNSDNEIDLSSKIYLCAECTPQEEVDFVESV